MERIEKRVKAKKKEGRRDSLHCTTEMDDFLVREMPGVCLGTDTEEDAYSMRGRDKRMREREKE